MPTASRAPLRSALAALVLAGLAGCSLSPDGSCEADRDCRSGRHCAERVCVPDGRSSLYGGCVVDLDCDPYALCTRGACVLAPGRCAETLDCAAWESCEANTCLPLPGRCGTFEDCAPWERCVAAASASPPLPEHRCEVAPGRCASATNCAAWQQCSPTRFCETAPGRCGVQDDCPSDQVCGTGNSCVAQPAPPALDPAAVHLVGTLAQGTPGRAAIAATGAPAAKLVGLAGGDLACGARLAPGGGLVLSRGAAALATLVPDPFLWDAAADAWVYPSAPAANDAAVPLPAGCAGAVSVSVVLQAGTGAHLFGCDGVWRDAAGAAVGGGQPLLARSAAGLFLAGTADMVTAPALLDAAGLEIPLSGTPMPAGDRLVAWRAAGDGFRVVRALGAAGYADLEVWTIDATGATALAPALPALPASAASVSAPLLDGAGAVHQLGATAAGDGLVVKRTAAGAAEVPYDEAALPAGTSLLDAPVRVDGTSCLVTGP